MVDECVDCANSEQLVVCFRHAHVHEEFVGLYHCASIIANKNVAVPIEIEPSFVSPSPML